MKNEGVHTAQAVWTPFSSIIKEEMYYDDMADYDWSTVNFRISISRSCSIVYVKEDRKSVV